MPLSAMLALSPEEKRFCIAHAAGLPITESYRRAFHKEIDKDHLSDGAIAQRASRLAKATHIVAALAELEQSAADRALQVYNDQMLLGNGSAVLGAAKAVLENEALQQARSDYERFLSIAAACGAVVKTRVGDEDVTVPVRELFPKFKDEVPPQHVQAKTAKALGAWYDKLSEREQELDARERELASGG